MSCYLSDFSLKLRGAKSHYQLSLKSLIMYARYHLQSNKPCSPFCQYLICQNIGDLIADSTAIAE